MTPGAGRWGGLWMLAGALSLAAHGAVAAALIWRPDGTAPPTPAATQPLRLDVTRAAAEATAQPEVLTALAPVEMPLGDGPAERALTADGSVILPDQGAPAPMADSPVLTPLPLTLPLASLSRPTPAPAAAAPAIAAAAPDLPPADPRITQLFERIRAMLTDACVFARPALLGDDQVQLSVFAADDRQIAAMMQDLTRDLTTPVTQAQVLLDPRQCPALAFARRDPAYPAPGLSLQLDRQDMASGQTLSGRVSGGVGFYTTLLLIDDQGVVHDLRRYLIGSAAGSRFDIPLARFGDARDTHQLIVALATPTRPNAVTRLPGDDAGRFFDALAAEVGQDVRAGVANVFLR